VNRPRVVVFDYGFGNVRSCQNSLIRAGADAVIDNDRSAARDCDGLVVPGVGAFAACMSSLRAAGGSDVIVERVAAGRPVLGVCVGMQVLFSHGVEHGVDTRGIGLWPGVVDRLDAPVLPHMGWNTVDPPARSLLFAGVADQRFYFVHSYAARRWDGGSPDALATWSVHGERFVAAVEDGPVWATQFHPEKSGDAGVRLLRNWLASLS
jgi:glutamine amidotransferase